jgi:hypothetical protein
LRREGKGREGKGKGIIGEGRCQGEGRKERIAHSAFYLLKVALLKRNMMQSLRFMKSRPNSLR